MRFEYYIAALLLVGNAQATHNFRLDDNVVEFVQTHKAKNLESTRHMLGGKPRSAAVSFPGSRGEKTYILDRAGLSEEFRANIWRNAKAKSRMSREIVEAEGGDEVYVISVPETDEQESFRQNWIVKPTKTVEQLEAEGKAAFKLLYPNLASEFVYSNNEIDYESIQDEKVITDIKLRFARLVEKTQVFGNVSYLELVLDGRGAVKRTRLKYPGIRAGRKLKDIRTESAMLDGLARHCEAGKHLEVLDASMREQVKASTVKAAIRAWIPIEKADGSVELTPGLGFFAEMVLQDHAVSKIVLEPFDKSLSVDDKSMKKTFTSVASAGNLNENGPIFAPVIKRGR